MAQELKAYNVVATVDVNPEVVDSLGCTEFAGYDADEVDAVLAEKDAEIEGLKRALWLTRAQRAADKQTYYYECRYDGWVHRVNVWLEVERKCRAKAEQYK